MVRRNKAKRGFALLCGCSLLGMAQPVLAQSADDGVEEASDAAAEADESVIIVTAQKRAENVQDVPIAISTFSEGALQTRGIAGAVDLRTQIPNTAFSRNAINTTNFQLRGIGNKLASSTADDGVGVHVNNAPLTSSRIADAEFYDVERIEVLRGPQGTLYGRNATGGVVNIITAKPDYGDLSASVTADVGNYGTMKLRGNVNVPLGDSLALRAAGYMLKREGYSFNTVTGRDADDRDLWSTRLTLGFEPSDSFSAFLMWEHFEENDRRVRNQKQLCTQDVGPTTVGGYPANSVAQGVLSTGCTNGSLYSPDALSAPNSLGTINGIVGLFSGINDTNTNAGLRQDPDLRRFESSIDPRYIAKNDLVELNMELELVGGLTLSSLTSYNKDSSVATQDADTFIPITPFNDTFFTPGGVFDDPQLGASTFSRSVQEVAIDTEQWSQEIRLQSDFDGPINFNIGGIYLDYENTFDFRFAATSFTQFAQILNLDGAGIFIDPTPDIDGSGHNYLFNRSPYRLTAKAAFGEVYWDVTDTLSVTGGLRYTDDKKVVDVIPATIFTPGMGLPITGQQRARFKELTGRLNIDWKPYLSFTDSSLFYASYSKGYKGGGFNPSSSVQIGGVQETYAPEFVNAFEIGTKNTLAGGAVTLNLSAFYYDYVDYQISKVVALTVANENIDATIKGLEFETVVEPTDGFRLNGTLGLLDTSIKSGSTSLDLLDRTQGDPTLTTVKNLNGTNCVANVDGVANVLAAIDNGIIPGEAFLALCDGAWADFGVVVSEGIQVDLDGKQLPDAPKWTLNLGAEYEWDISDAWSLTMRGDYYRQGSSFARIYNAEVDRLRAWDNINLSAVLENRDEQFKVQLYVRNLADKTVITSTTTNAELFGLTSQVYLNDPRTYGIALTKSF